jgi:hypothetical protein
MTVNLDQVNNILNVLCSLNEPANKGKKLCYSDTAICLDWYWGRTAGSWGKSLTGFGWNRSIKSLLPLIQKVQACLNGGILCSQDVKTKIQVHQICPKLANAALGLENLKKVYAGKDEKEHTIQLAIRILNGLVTTYNQQFDEYSSSSSSIVGEDSGEESEQIFNQYRDAIGALSRSAHYRPIAPPDSQARGDTASLQLEAALADHL